MAAQEWFLPLENYRSEWDKPKQLEIFAEEATAQILDIFNATPKDVRDDSHKVEQLDINKL